MHVGEYLMYSIRAIAYSTSTGLWLRLVVCAEQAIQVNEQVSGFKGGAKRFFRLKGTARGSRYVDVSMAEILWVACLWQYLIRPRRLSANLPGRDSK